jgi:hypothetical protein
MLIKDLGSGICLKGRIINGLLVGEGKKEGPGLREGSPNRKS